MKEGRTTGADQSEEMVAYTKLNLARTVRNEKTVKLLPELRDALAQARKLDVVTFRDWKKIEEAEAARAREGAPREKFVDIAEMIRARD